MPGSSFFFLSMIFALLQRAFWLLVGCLLLASLALAHDPSAWGGMFRTRDAGGTWLPIDGGLFIGGAIGLAVDPSDPNHLLYATDTRLLRSRNGGRDWVQEQPSVFFGPVLAAAFDARGASAIVATSAGLYRNQSGAREWTPVPIPASASPARYVAAGADAGWYYVAGAQGLYRSLDAGASWQRIGETLPETPASALVVQTRPSEIVYAVVQGTVWAGTGGGVNWSARSAGLPLGQVEVVALDPRGQGLWSAAAGRLYASGDQGQTWTPQGEPLPESGISVRGVGISGDGTRIVLATHRGLYRSTDAGHHWSLIESNLPVHLEAGPLVRDPNDPDTLYAGFSLTPYGEIWRRAEQGTSLLALVDPVSLAGGAAFLALLLAAGLLLVRKLIKLSSSTSGRATTKTS